MIRLIVAFVVVCSVHHGTPHVASAAGTDGRLLVILSPQGAESATRAAGSLAGKYGFEIISSERIGAIERDCYVFGLPPGVPMGDRQRLLQAEPLVENVQAMQVFTVAGTVDPYVNLQHSLVGARIDESHRISTGRDVKVAIIDTGMDRTHADLRGRVERVLNFVDADRTMEIIEFHATAVAGIIGARAQNGRGIVGIAPRSRMFSLRACWESIPGTSRGQCNSLALALALDWAITNGMKVVNMSLEGEEDALVARLITRAVEAGLIVVAATGLDEGQLSFPASMGEVIAVSYHDSTRAVDYVGNAGKVFIAPGEEVLTTMPDNTYDFVSGSSFASAHISGIVALLAEQLPTIDAHTAKAVLRSSTRVTNWTVLVDACVALATVTGSDSCRPPPP